MYKTQEEIRRSKEEAFHDQAAIRFADEKMAPSAPFEAPTAMENRFILEQIGSLQGKKILDLGGGSGEAAVYFAINGADSFISDISSGMVDLALKAAESHNVTVTASVCPAEQLDYPENFFDVVYLNGVLHHVSNRPDAYKEIARVLRSGGLFFAIEPLAGNPLINIYRKMASKMRSEDETPLTLKELTSMRPFFKKIRHREFWFMSLFLFVKYYLVDRVHPNNDRYWKRIYKETNRSLWWWWPFRLSDSILTRVPIVRNWCWNTVIWGEK